MITETGETVPDNKNVSVEVRRLRTILPRPLYRRLAVQAAREESATNAVIVRAIETYLAAVEGAP